MDGVEFVIDLPPCRPSEPGCFTIAKPEPYVRFYESLVDKLSPEGILELGILEGGSFVFLDKLFSPQRMAAIDLSPNPVEPLDEYVSTHPNRHAHFSTSQTDEAALESIVTEELEGKLDLIIDDASHTYEHTKKSFEILFPLLSPGGLYVVEDWSWAHNPDHQSEDAHFASEPALTNLLFEQLILLGSTVLISKITVLRYLYVIEKSKKVTPFTDRDVWEGILNRGKALVQI